MPEFTVTRTTAARYRIAVIDGPNMSNLGRRNRKVYGAISSLSALQDFVVGFGAELGVDVEVFSSNFEGAILEFIHESADRVDGYVINPAGIMAHGIATPHALFETGKPVVEVHFANTAAASGSPRGGSLGPVESQFTPHMTGMMMGMRQYSYTGALLGLVQSLDDESFLGA